MIRTKPGIATNSTPTIAANNIVRPRAGSRSTADTYPASVLAEVESLRSCKALLPVKQAILRMTVIVAGDVSDQFAVCTGDRATIRSTFGVLVANENCRRFMFSQALTVSSDGRPSDHMKRWPGRPSPYRAAFLGPLGWRP